MFIVKAAIPPAEQHAAIQEVIARMHAETPMRFVTCPSCDGLGFHEKPWLYGGEFDREPCPCCDQSGLVLPEERDNWFEFSEGLR